MAWKNCVETKYCTLPPHPPAGGSVKVISDGYMYGRNCSTIGYEIVNGTGGCETKLSMEKSVVLGGFRVSTYKVMVLKRPPGGNLVMRLTFSQPVDTASVKIDPADVAQSMSNTSLVVEAALSNTGVATFLVVPGSIRRP